MHMKVVLKLLGKGAAKFIIWLAAHLEGGK